MSDEASDEAYIPFDAPTGARTPFMCGRGRFLFGANWAKTLCWCDDSPDRTRRTVQFFAIEVICQRTRRDNLRMFKLTAGPLQLMIGVISPRKRPTIAEHRT